MRFARRSAIEEELASCRFPFRRRSRRTERVYFRAFERDETLARGAAAASIAIDGFQARGREEEGGGGREGSELTSS